MAENGLQDGPAAGGVSADGVAMKGLAEADYLYRLRHSAAHVLAEAVLDLYPDAKLGIGPAISDGFYYDFDLGKGPDGKAITFTPEDLERLEVKMREIVAGRHNYAVRDVSAAEAEAHFADQPYKVELIRDLAAGNVNEYGEPVDEPVPITIYTQDTFSDLCRGPHVPHTGYIEPKGLKLVSTAAAYWRGSEKNPMLQRIYGTAWRSKSDLEAHLARLAEMEKRDHRRIGVDLDLYSTAPDHVGGGLILWHPKGALMRHLIESFAKERHLAGGYAFVNTPHIGRSTLWETSGHLGFYKDSMYAPLEIDNQAYYLKPMNCPFHIMIYKSQRRSYRELPLRFAEWGTVYRFERSGTLHGLLRVRGFTQDDAHIFVQPSKVEDEIYNVLEFSLSMLEAFGFKDFKVWVSTRPEKRVGSEADWETAEAALLRAVQKRGLAYDIKPGEGAFYGPKIDIDVADALGRAWQLSTIQFDFNMSARFDLAFQNDEGVEERPFMVHRALFGSMERFFGVLIEHYGGAFPVWLSPVQATIIPIADRHLPYADEVARRLVAAGLRAEVDSRSDRMRAKIRDAQLQKVPYMLVVGDREAEEGAVSVRLRTEVDKGDMPLDDFIAYVKEAVAARSGVEGE